MPLTPNEIKEKLLGSLDGEYNVLNEDVVVEVIGILERFPITKEDLELTRIGKHVNELRRKTANQDLCRRAKNLVRSWQKLVLQQDVSASTPTTASPRLPSRPSSNNLLPRPRTSSPLVSGSPAGTQPCSPAAAYSKGNITPGASPLVRAQVSPAPPARVGSISGSVGRPGPPTVVPAVAALRATGRMVSPAAALSDRTQPALSGKNNVLPPGSTAGTVSSPALQRLPVGASSSPAARPSPSLPGVAANSASPRLPSTPAVTRHLPALGESPRTSGYARTATPPCASAGVKSANAERLDTGQSFSASQSPSAPAQKTPKTMDLTSSRRNGAAADGRSRVTPQFSAAAVSPAMSSSAPSVSTPARPTHGHHSGASHVSSPATPKYPANERTNGDLTVERAVISRTNAANKKRRRSDDSAGGSSTSSAPPVKSVLLNGDSGAILSSHASAVSMRNTLAPAERRPSKVKTTAQLIAELQASKGGDDLLKSDTITKIVSNQIEREKYVEHESVVPPSAKPRPRKKPVVLSPFGKPPDTPDGSSLARTKSEMVQKYLSSSLLVSSGNGDDSQMTFASSSPSTVGAASFLAPDNAADHDEGEDEFVDIEGLDAASTPEGQKAATAPAARPSSVTAAAVAALSHPQDRVRNVVPSDPYSLLPPLNLDEIEWSDDDERLPTQGEALVPPCDEVAVSRLHDGRWPGVNGVFSDGREQWHDWTETIVRGNETGSTLFILPYVDVGD